MQEFADIVFTYTRPKRFFVPARQDDTPNGEPTDGGDDESEGDDDNDDDGNPLVSDPAGIKEWIRESSNVEEAREILDKDPMPPEKKKNFCLFLRNKLFVFQVVYFDGQELKEDLVRWTGKRFKGRNLDFLDFEDFERKGFKSYNKSSHNLIFFFFFLLWF